MSMFALFVSLWGLVAPQTTVRHLDGPVRFTDLYGAEREAAAALACPESGRPVLYLSPSVDLETMVHELAHARDCIDDGALNASPIGGARPGIRPKWASDYCWESDAEWYACWVVHTRSLDTPLATAPPGPLHRARGWLTEAGTFLGGLFAGRGIARPA